MFSAGILSAGIAPSDGKTLQHYLINSTCKRAPSELPAMENSIQDKNPGHHIGLNPSTRESCNHTTCGETCLFQAYQTSKLSDTDRDSSFIHGGKQSRGTPYQTDDFQWDDPMINSPAAMQGQPGLEEQERDHDILSEIDYTLRQSVDAEIEAFRINLHNLLAEQHHQYRQIFAPENDPVIEQRTVYDSPAKMDASYVWSPMNSEQPQIEESSSSSYSMQDDDASELYHPNNHEDEINSVLVQLLTSASAISHALRRQEYAT